MTSDERNWRQRELEKRQEQQERELWCFVAGAALASKEHRQEAFELLDTAHIKWGDLGELLEAVKGSNAEKAWRAAERWGIPKNGKLASSIINHLSSMVQSRVCDQLMRRARFAAKHGENEQAAALLKQVTEIMEKQQ